MSTSHYFGSSLGTPRPLPYGLDLPYHDGLREHRLVLPRCPSCGTWRWPPEVLCWRCHHFGLDWVEVEPHGRVHSWTRVWHAARPELNEDLPYLVVLVELAHADDVRLLGNLLGPGTQEVRCGDEVTGVFEDSADGTFALLQWEKRTIGRGGVA